MIERAALTGLALVDRPAHPAAKAETRARSGRTLRAEIPIGQRLQCECQGPDCDAVEPTPESVDPIFTDSFFGGATERIVAAYLENYSGPLASTSRGTLRGAIRGTGFEGRRPIVEIEFPDSAVGRDLIAAWEDSGIIVRPFVADMQGEIVDGVRRVTGGRLRALIVSSTDARDGWDQPEIVRTPDEYMMEGCSAPRRRRIWL